MKSKIQRALAASALSLAAIAAPVNAGEQGVYLSVGAGIDFLSDVEGSETIDGVNYEATIENENGFGYGGAIGYDFGSWRVEGEYRKSSADIDSVSGKADSTSVTATADGDIEVESYFLNAYYDYETDRKITPYIGVGIGSARGSVENLVVNSVSVGSGDDTGTAYQFKLGLNYQLSDNTDVFAEGAYTRVNNLDVDGADIEDMGNWGSTFGLRFNF